MKRFGLLFLCLVACSPLPAREDAPNKRPNIIYIYTDQQSATMMGCAGNKWLQTPAMDTIAENGIRFTRAYTTNPVCCPARISLMSGRFPGYFRTDKGNIPRENRGGMRVKKISPEVRATTLGVLMQKAGYELAYGGKTHLPVPLAPKAQGFRYLCRDARDKLADEAARFIKADHEKPYFLVVSLINPHDICFMALLGITGEKPDGNGKWKKRRDVQELKKALRIPEGVSRKEFFEKHCPPLPPNLEPQEGEPEAVRSLLRGRKFRMDARKNYTDEDWRLHRWAYCRLTELVDQRVQKVLDALKASGQEENTLVIFSSDHGDMDGAHRTEHKSFLYEESANIPFMAMWKGRIPAGRVDQKHLVSNGLDLLPTLCDYAGIEGVADPRGRSLKPLLEGKKVEWRETLGVESEIGRMVVDRKGHKYIRYDAAGKEERLHDLKKDPYEKTHFTGSAEHQAVLDRLRKSFDTEWFPGVDEK